jgi:hypothetical protein
MSNEVRYINSLEYLENNVSLRIVAPHEILYSAAEAANININRQSYGARSIAHRAFAAMEGYSRLTFDLTAIGRRKIEHYRERDLVATMKTIAATEAAAQKSIPEDERPLSFFVDQTLLPDGSHLAMSARVLRPEGSHNMTSYHATKAMRRAAKAIRYNHDFAKEENMSNVEYDEFINDMVYAHYQPEHGLELQTNPHGSCSMGTVGDEYDPISRYIELEAHNLYTPEQQLICLVGAVAIAERAEE